MLFYSPSVSSKGGGGNRKSKPRDSRLNCDVNVKLDLKVDRAVRAAEQKEQRKTRTQWRQRHGIPAFHDSL